MKILRKVFGIALLLSGSIMSPSLAQSWEVSEENAEIVFEAIAMKRLDVEGHFGKFAGKVTFDPSDLAGASINVCIEAASLESGNKMRDKHLRNEDFFHVEVHPEICFRSQSVEKTDTGFVARGMLVMAGKEKALDIPFTFENGTMKSSFTLSRFAYGLGESVKAKKASDEITLRISSSSGQ